MTPKVTLLRQIELYMGLPAGLAMNNSHLFYTDIKNDGGLYKLNLENGEKTVILPRSQACQPHGLSIFKGDIIFTDTASHQVKLVKLSSPGQISPLIGSGLTGRRYGPSSVARLTQPTGIVSVGGTFIFVIRLKIVSSLNQGQMDYVNFIVIKEKC